jgi:hypothetical protein
MPFVIALVVGAVLGAATYFFGGQFLPDAASVYLRGEAGSQAADIVVDQLALASAAAAFIGWSLGLFVGARR